MAGQIHNPDSPALLANTLSRVTYKQSKMTTEVWWVLLEKRSQLPTAEKAPLYWEPRNMTTISASSNPPRKGFVLLRKVHVSLGMKGKGDYSAQNPIRWKGQPSLWVQVKTIQGSFNHNLIPMLFKMLKGREIGRKPSSSFHKQSITVITNQNE